PTGFGATAMTSPLPLSSTVRISWAPQFAYQRRPSCQRGDSPTTSPVTSVRSSAILHRLRLRRGPKLIDGEAERLPDPSVRACRNPLRLIDVSISWVRLLTCQRLRPQASTVGAFARRPDGG